MNGPKSRDNVVRAWLQFNYSTQALEWQMKNKHLNDLPLFARTWEGEHDY